MSNVITRFFARIFGRVDIRGPGAANPNDTRARDNHMSENPNCARCGFPKSEHRLGYSRSRCQFDIIPTSSRRRALDAINRDDAKNR